MKLSKEGRAFFIQEEGYRTKPYKDQAGFLTIGIGHKLTPSELSSGKIYIKGIPFQYSHGLPESAVDSLFEKDLARFELAVNTHVHAPLTQSQYDALVSFAFNIGSEAFRNSTLVKRLNQDPPDYLAVPGQMKRWKHSGGHVIQALVKRREREIDLWSRA